MEPRSSIPTDLPSQATGPDTLAHHFGFCLDMFHALGLSSLGIISGLQVFRVQGCRGLSDRCRRLGLFRTSVEVEPSAKELQGSRGSRGFRGGPVGPGFVSVSDGVLPVWIQYQAVGRSTFRQARASVFRRA